jgi:hypothetical protein
VGALQSLDMILCVYVSATVMCCFQICSVYVFVCVCVGGVGACVSAMSDRVYVKLLLATYVGGLWVDIPFSSWGRR